MHQPMKPGWRERLRKVAGEFARWIPVAYAAYRAIRKMFLNRYL